MTHTYSFLKRRRDFAKLHFGGLCVYTGRRTPGLVCVPAASLQCIIASWNNMRLRADSVSSHRTLHPIAFIGKNT